MKAIFKKSLTLPQRLKDAHKGNHGSVAIIGGADGMLGAVTLASRAALLAGAGRVYACFLSSEAPKLDVVHPEIMMHSPSSLHSLSQLECIVIGPGLGSSDEAKHILSACLQGPTQLLIDADALNLIAKNDFLRDLLKQREDFSVMTPHAGEAARLLQISSEDIQTHRVECALQLAQKYHAIFVLKGAGTIVVQKDEYVINTTGNAGLASGGTGDVLSGIIGALIAQGLSPFEASKTGVFIHGAAADALVLSGVGPIGLSASEIASEVRQVLNSFNLRKN